MAALNRAWSLRCQVRSAGAGSVVEGLALAVIVRGGVSFPGGRYVAPIASATRRASPEFSGPGARRTPRNRHLRTLPGERPPGCTRIPRCRMSYQVIFAVDRHDDMSLYIVRFVRGGDHRAVHARPAGPARLREAINPRLEETGPRHKRTTRPRADRGGERCPAAAAERYPPGPRGGRSQGLVRPARPGRAGEPGGPGSCPAGKRSGSRWPGAWSPGRRCCSLTSRPARLTRCRASW